MKEIVESGVYGKIKRINWIVTDWFRPNAYYNSGSWKSTELAFEKQFENQLELKCKK